MVVTVIVVIVVMVVVLQVVLALVVAAVAVVAVSIVVMVVPMVVAVVAVLVWVEVVGVYQVGASALVVHADGEGFWLPSVAFFSSALFGTARQCKRVRFTREGCLCGACCRDRLKTCARAAMVRIGRDGV